MPSSSTYIKGAPDGGSAPQNIWQTISQMNRRELMELWGKVNFYLQYESSSLDHNNRPHHSQLPKLETGLQDFSIGEQTYGHGDMFSEKGYAGFESHTEIKMEGTDLPMTAEGFGWPVGTQDRAPVGDLNRLRAEYERTMRELRVAEEEYEDIAAERENAIRDFKAAELVKNQLARRRIEIERRMRGFCV